jgi:two-component system KDP operon response regulator KdpE
MPDNAILASPGRRGCPSVERSRELSRQRELPAVRILVADDDPRSRAGLVALVQQQGFDVIVARDGPAAIAAASAGSPDVMLLNLGVSDMAGLEVMRRLREWTRTPILIISTRENEGDKLAAFESGADDYLLKPFSVPELIARIRVALRHAKPKEESVLHFDPLRLDLASRGVTRDGERIRLTLTEYKLLARLARSAGKVMTYRELLSDVWGPRCVTQKQYLYVYIGRLRRKLEPNPTRPRFILTAARVGYRFKAEDRTWGTARISAPFLLTHPSWTPLETSCAPPTSGPHPSAP